MAKKKINKNTEIKKVAAAKAIRASFPMKNPSSSSASKAVKAAHVATAVKKNSAAKNIPEQKKKPVVGFYGVTGCAGCLLSVIFNEDEILDIVDVVDLKAFPFIKEVNINDHFDVAFIEGLVASEEDLETIKTIREHTGFLVALGACATPGCVPAYRTFTLKENYEHLLYAKDGKLRDLTPSPIDAHIKVDYYIPGCPPDKREIMNFIKSIVRGKIPVPYSSPVCIECRRNGNACLLDQGKPCLGPITAGGCNSVCVNGGLECWGCRGPTKDMNLELMIKILKKKGFDDKFIQDRMRTFAGLKLPMLEQVMAAVNSAQDEKENKQEK